jgi:hypothetical protein
MAARTPGGPSIAVLLNKFTLDIPDDMKAEVSRLTRDLPDAASVLDTLQRAGTTVSFHCVPVDAAMSIRAQADDGKAAAPPQVPSQFPPQVRNWLNEVAPGPAVHPVAR